MIYREMKIGILTLPLNTNYGGILQAYALQTVLERMGHEVEVIQWKKNEFKGFPWYKAILVYAKRLLLGRELRREYRLQREGKIIYQPMQESIDRLIHYTNQTIDSKKNLIKYCNQSKFDAFVVGSDQVWRKSYGDDNKSFFNFFQKQKSYPQLATYFLDFVDDLKILPLKISYAASFGVDYAEYSPKESLFYGKLLSKFNVVSVREQQGVQLIKDIYKWNVVAQQVLDPTMLLNAEDYLALVNQQQCKRNQSSYILYYVLDENLNTTKISKEISDSLGMPIVKISVNEQEGTVEERIMPSVEEWLSLFANADFILTDSFHGTVFSIIFNKPFYVVGNVKRGMARFNSLLSQFNIENRLLISGVQKEKFIDWQIVNKNIETAREKSMAVFERINS